VSGIGVTQNVDDCTREAVAAPWRGQEKRGVAGGSWQQDGLFVAGHEKFLSCCCMHAYEEWERLVAAVLEWQCDLPMSSKLDVQRQSRRLTAVAWEDEDKEARTLPLLRSSVRYRGTAQAWC